MRAIRSFLALRQSSVPYQEKNVIGYTKGKLFASSSFPNSSNRRNGGIYSAAQSSKERRVRVTPAKSTWPHYFFSAPRPLARDPPQNWQCQGRQVAPLFWNSLDRSKCQVWSSGCRRRDVSFDTSQIYCPLPGHRGENWQRPARRQGKLSSACMSIYYRVYRWDRQGIPWQDSTDDRGPWSPVVGCHSCRKRSSESRHLRTLELTGISHQSVSL